MSLLEALVAVLLSALLLLTAVQFILGLWQGEQVLRQNTEGYANVASLRRNLGLDTHSALAAVITHAGLILTLVNGETDRYVLNKKQQIVRIGNGGGSSVLATGIQSVAYEMQDSLLTVEGHTVDGGAFELELALPLTRKTVAP